MWEYINLTSSQLQSIFASNKPRSILHNHATETRYFIATAARNLLATSLNMTALPTSTDVQTPTIATDACYPSPPKARLMQPESTKKKQATCDR